MRSGSEKKKAGMKSRPCESYASGAVTLTAGGPGACLRAPGGFQGQRPGGGRGGEAPWSPRLFDTLKCNWACILAPYLAIISTHFSYKICILRQVCRILSMLPFWIKVFYIISSILGDLQPPITTSCGPIIGHWQVTKAPPERRPECFYEPEPLSTQV